MEPYTLLLTLHNWVRLVIVVTGLWALFAAVSGMQSRRPLTSRGPFTAFMGSIHLQVLLGVILFAVMGMNGNAPFPDGPRPSFGWEHLGLGILAAVFAMLAGRASKPLPPRTGAAPQPLAGNAGAVAAAQPDPADRRQWISVLTWVIAAWACILLMMPWTRPMLRMFS